MTCKHCQKGIPLQHGIHMMEQHMERCTRELSLEPKHSDTWHQPEKRKRERVPFVVESER